MQEMGVLWICGEQCDNPRRASMHPDSLRSLGLFPLDEVRVELQVKSKLVFKVFTFVVFENAEVPHGSILLPEWCSRCCRIRRTWGTTSFVTKLQAQRHAVELVVECFELLSSVPSVSDLLSGASGAVRANVSSAIIAGLVRSNMEGDVVALGAVFAVRSQTCLLVCRIIELKASDDLIPPTAIVSQDTSVRLLPVRVTSQSPRPLFGGGHADALETVYEKQLHAVISFVESNLC